MMKFQRTTYSKLTFVLVMVLVIACDNAVSQDKTGKAGCPSYFNKELKKNVFLYGDSLPEFTGGQTGYMRFLNKNLRVPEEVLQNQGSPPMVVMEFVIDEKGKLNCISLNDKRDTSSFDSMEKEVLRLLHLMPDWEPGTCNGKRVPMKIRIPFLGCIRLEDE